MIRNSFSFAAVLLAAALPAAQAAHVPTNPRETLRELEASARQAQSDADQLRMFISNANLSADSHLLELNELKADINTMGKELAILENERASLSSWEQQAIGKVEPLLKAEAKTTDDAIHFFNDHRSYLWAPDYRDDAVGIANDSRQIADTVKDYLKYSKARDQEQHLKTSLGVASE